MGGEHSGHHGHAGRPGSVGGSAPGFASLGSFIRLTNSVDDGNPYEGNLVLDIINDRGFNGKPSLVSPKELDKEIILGAVELHRGIQDASHREQFKKGELFVGKGPEGSGVYSSTDPREAEGFGFGGTVRMALKPSAKVIDFRDLEEKAYQLYKQGGVYDKLTDDLGATAVALGYDAIKAREGRVYVILNRTMLFVEE